MLTRISISRSFTKSQWLSFSTEDKTRHQLEYDCVILAIKRVLSVHFRISLCVFCILLSDKNESMMKFVSSRDEKLVHNIPCTTPHGYCLARTILLPTFTSSLLPTTANGRCACSNTNTRLTGLTGVSNAHMLFILFSCYKTLRWHHHQVETTNAPHKRVCFQKKFMLVSCVFLA